MGMGGNRGGRMPELPQQMPQGGLRATYAPPGQMSMGPQQVAQMAGGMPTIGARAPWLPPPQPMSAPFQFRPHQQLGMGAMPMPPQRSGPMLPPGPGGMTDTSGATGSTGVSAPIGAAPGSQQDRLAQQQQLAEQLRTQGAADQVTRDADRVQTEATRKTQAEIAAAQQAEIDADVARRTAERQAQGGD